jgi:hypothetical protein
MDDNENNNRPVEKPEVLAQLEAAAAKGLSKRAIASLCGKKPKDFDVYLLLHPESELAIERGWASREEKKLARREYAADKAEQEGNWSLVYKEAHDAWRTQLERDATVRVQHVAPEEQGMPDLEWGVVTDEEQAAIRANTEAKDRGNDAE